MRILYVEDNPANLFLVQRVARIGNHEIINYTDGQTALDRFATDKPDLVLMDVQLPGLLTGLDVVKALRDAGHRVPIIAVTAYAMMGDKERCIEAGCDGYMAKPMPVSDLVEVMKRYDPGVSAKPPVEASPAAVEKPVTDKPEAPVQTATTSEKPTGDSTPVASPPVPASPPAEPVSLTTPQPVGHSEPVKKLEVP
jgi:two-component system cell cycle response regulator DivK